VLLEASNVFHCRQTNKHSKNTWNGKFYLKQLFELFEQNTARGNTGCETHQWWRWDRKNQHMFFKLARHEGWETMPLCLQDEVQNTLVVTHRLNTEVYWNKRPEEETQPPPQTHKM